VWSDLEAFTWNEVDSETKDEITDLLHDNGVRISACIIGTMTNVLQRLTVTAEGDNFDQRIIDDLESLQTLFASYQAGELHAAIEFKAYFLRFPVEDTDVEGIQLDLATWH